VSCVDRDVLRIALGLTLVSAPAFAEVYEEEEAQFHEAPGMGLAVGFFSHDSEVGGTRASGVGAGVEGALGHGRTQFFAELSVMSAKLETMNAPGPRGTFGRTGAGVRWLARQFQPEREFGVELFLEAVAGVERYWWDGGGQLTRPDLGIGVGTQTRIWEFHNLTIRLEGRVLFAPTDPGSSLIACRGTGCPVGTSGSSAGFTGGIVIGW
jgi:hypothetical protein